MSIKLFKEEKIHPELLAKAGETFLVALYKENRVSENLQSLRYTRFVKSATKSKTNLASLPPTSDAAKQHSFRTYLQVQAWLGNQLDPEKWGWSRTRSGLQAVTITGKAAPDALLKLIACKCKGNCGQACGCRKAGLKCSTICQNCNGKNCENIPDLPRWCEEEAIDIYSEDKTTNSTLEQHKENNAHEKISTRAESTKRRKTK